MEVEKVGRVGQSVCHRHFLRNEYGGKVGTENPYTYSQYNCSTLSLKV